jgi:antitoxin component YwqK of YwqJK toxin-antitoxin module
MSKVQYGICYAKINKYILTLNNGELIEIEDFTNNKFVDELLMFKKGKKYNNLKTFKSRDECFYYKFFEDNQMLFFENGYNGLYKEYDQNSRVVREFYHINGSINGIAKMYYHDSHIKTEINYIDNVAFDKKIFNKTNKLVEYSKYIIDNKCKKEYVEKYFESGVLSDKYIIINDKIDGEYIKYYENGKIFKHEFYINGKKNNMHKSFYQNGILNTEISYENNLFEGIHNTYNKYGKLLLKQNYVKNKLNGEKIEYFDDNNPNTDNKKIKIICNYIDGCLDGEYKEYYENQNLKLLCNFKYDKSCELKYMGKNYVNITKCEKNKHGEFVEFYENGLVHKRGYYVNNKLNGDYTFYDTNGDIIKVIKYKNNEYMP